VQTGIGNGTDNGIDEDIDNRVISNKAISYNTKEKYYSKGVGITDSFAIE
jgi:hypothetical protein